MFRMNRFLQDPWHTKAIHCMVYASVNDISKRKNRTIMEMAHSMLAAKHFPNEYWGEAVATAIYIMSRCRTKSVKNKVPQDAWTGMNRSVSHLKVLVVLHVLMFQMSSERS